MIAVGRNSAWIVAEDETEPRLASLRRVARSESAGRSDSGGREMVVPGDLVEAKVIADDRVVIDTIHPRGFALVRRTGGGRTKTMAANVDTIAMVAALVDPPLHLVMIDQLVAFALQHDVEPLLLLTKADLAGEEAAERIAGLYRAVRLTRVERGSCRAFGKRSDPNDAGADGFEPSHGGFKARCLTAWRRPTESDASDRCAHRFAPSAGFPRRRELRAASAPSG